MAVSTLHHFVIEPHKGVGPIRFGMHKDDVSHAFTYVYTSFFKVAESKVRADHCEVVGLIIHYDDEGRVNHIEVYKARYATVTLELFGQDITARPARIAGQGRWASAFAVGLVFFLLDCGCVSSLVV